MIEAVRSLDVVLLKSALEDLIMEFSAIQMIYYYYYYYYKPVLRF